MPGGRLYLWRLLYALWLGLGHMIPDAAARCMNTGFGHARVFGIGSQSSFFFSSILTSISFILMLTLMSYTPLFWVLTINSGKFFCVFLLDIRRISASPASASYTLPPEARFNPRSVNSVSPRITTWILFCSGGRAPWWSFPLSSKLVLISLL